MTDTTTIKARFNELVQAFDGHHDELDAIERAGDHMMGYVKHVEWMDRNAEIWRLRLDPPDFREKFSEQDQIRRNKRQLAISATKRLNALARQADVALLFGGDTGDRYAVAQFAGDFSAAFYEHGRSRRPVRSLSVAPTPEAILEKDGPEL